MDLSPLVSALIGGVIGGAFSLGTQRYFWDRSRKARKHDRLVEATGKWFAAAEVAFRARYTTFWNHIELARDQASDSESEPSAAIKIERRQSYLRSSETTVDAIRSMVELWLMLRLQIGPAHMLMKAGGFTAAIQFWPHPAPRSEDFEKWLLTVTRAPEPIEEWGSGRERMYHFYRKEVIQNALDVFLAQIAIALDRSDPLVSDTIAE